MTVILLIVLAFFAELIDSGLGMMYGTILSPLLIILGFNPYYVVPAILLSQGLGGLMASFRHNHFKNGDFKLGSDDTKVALVISILGIVGVILGVWVGKSIPKEFLRLYISILCIIMGLIVISKKRFKFNWKGILAIGFVSSFNKAFSGGGFGPIVTSSQVILNRKEHNAISSTDLAEVPICISAFVLWVIAKGFPSNELLWSLIGGSLMGAFIGPKLLYLIRNKNREVLTRVIGILVTLLGIISLFKIQI